MDARFKSNLAMIGRNEPITKKAKFWQSYVRALKGTDDMRAPEHTHRPRGIFRSDFPELHSSSWPYGKSIYDNPLHAADRINVPGYRYLPVHREIYGYSPRQLYPHQYKPIERFTPGDFPGKWQYLRQLTESSDLKQQQIIRKWANRERNLYSSIMKIRCLKNTRQYPELWGNAEAFAAAAHPPFLSSGVRGEPARHTMASILNDSFNRHYPTIGSKPFDANKAWNDHLDRLADIDRLYPSSEPLLSRHRSPALKSKPLFDIHGNLLDDLFPSSRWPSLLGKKTLFDLLEPHPSAPVSAFTRDPWWYPCMAPYIPSYAQWSTPFYLRDSYLSPVKRNYLWSRHPLRPFAHAH